jgi:hypothetical protein
MSVPACYLVFAPSVELILPVVYHSHAQELLGEIPDEIVVPMSTCVMNPGVVDVSYDQVNSVVIVTPVGGGAPLAMVFTGAGAAAELEEKDDW